MSARKDTVLKHPPPLGWSFLQPAPFWLSICADMRHTIPMQSLGRWLPQFEKKLGAPTADAAYDPETATWTRTFASGTAVAFNANSNTGTIAWATTTSTSASHPAPPPHQHRRHHHPLQSQTVATGPRTIKIAFYNGVGAFSSGNKTHEREFYSAIDDARAQLAARHNVQSSVTNVTGSTVTKAVKSGEYALVIFPGGSGGGQSNGLGEDGRKAVRTFVANGGGYIGTCGGAFLAMTHLHLYGDNVSTVEPWARGHGLTQVEFTSGGASALELDASVYADKNVTIMYWQGPIVKNSTLPEHVSRL